MATSMTSNKLVWVLVGVLAVIVIVTVVNSGNSTDNKETNTQAQDTKKSKKTAANAEQHTTDVKQKAGKDDGDTVTETLKEVKVRYEKSLEENDKLKNSQDELLRRISVLENKRQPDNTQFDPKVTEFMKRLDSVENSVGTLANNIVPKAMGKNENGNGYEVSNEDLGWGDTETSNKNKKGYSVGPRSLVGYVLVQPMTRSALLQADPKLAEKMLHEKLASAESDLTDAKDRAEKSELTNTLKKAGTKEIDHVTRFRTIPKRATGFEAVGMTALIGTVPVGGKIQDPFPVKFILGDENFSSNGMNVPGLKGVVIDGIARGNWNLSCVSVTLTGATYTFADGTVQAMDYNQGQNGSGEDNKNKAVSPFAEGEGARGIGFIANPQGIPCIPGRRITDAHKQLFTLGLLGTAKSYFDAKAAAETTSTRNPLGGSSSDVTGDKDVFVNNTTYSNAMGTVMDFYNKRMRDSFDVIYVDPGEKVMLNFTQDLYVDYHSSARKLTYASGGKYEHAMD